MLRKKYLSYIWAALSVLALATFLVFSSTASGAAEKGISLCINTVIPVLFPIFVINNLLINSGCAKRIAAVLKRPVRLLFGVSENGVYPVIIGILCGAPSGCISLMSMINEGTISSDETDQIAFLSSPVSFSFISATVGGRMLGSIRYGILIFIIQIISIILSERILKVIFRQKMKEFHRFPSLSDSCGHGTSLLGSAIGSSVTSILSVCGTIVFFSAISGIICSAPFLPVHIKALLTALLEITSGTSYIAENISGNRAFLYLCAASGWSGLSIIFQCLSAIGTRASSRFFLVGKCLCSLLCLLLGSATIAAGIV